MGKTKLENTLEQIRAKVCRLKPTPSHTTEKPTETSRRRPIRPSGITALAIIMQFTGFTTLVYTGFDLMNIIFALAMLIFGVGIALLKEWALYGTIGLNALFVLGIPFRLILGFVDFVSPTWFIAIVPSLFIIFYLIQPGIQKKFRQSG